MWWPQIIVMCTIYVCIASDRASDKARMLKDLEPKPTMDLDTCYTWDCIKAASFIGKNMNSSIDPCDDFYEFTCGGSAESAKYGVKYMFDTANDELERRLKNVIEEIDELKSAKPFKLVKILYENCMIDDEMSEADVNRYCDMLEDIFGWPVLAGRKWSDLSFGNKVILPALLEVNFEPDTLNTNNRIPWIKLRRRTLDSEILRMGYDNKIVQAYHDYMVDIAVILGVPKTRATDELKEALFAELKLARDSFSEADRLMPHYAYTRTTVGEFADKYSNRNIREFIYSQIPQNSRLTDGDAIMVPKNFPNIEEVISKTPKRVLANLMWWYRVESSAWTVAEELRDRITKFTGLIDQPDAKWKQCVRTVRSHLGLSLSALYQKKYFDQKTATDTDDMATSIWRRIYEIMEEAEWLDSPSRRVVLQKIENIKGHISFRDEYKDDKKLVAFYKDLELARGDVQQSIANISAFLLNITRRNSEHYFKRNDWTVNGNMVSMFPSYYYEPNIYSVPAAFVLSNYYNLHGPIFLNYAGLGFHISHVMSRSLDSIGMYIDQHTALHDQPIVPKQEFDDRVKCIIDQERHYTIDEVGLELRAYTNLAGNTADNLAVKTAYRAYLFWANQHEAELPLPGLHYTPKQMFWIGVGNALCTKYQDLGLMKAVLTDDQSPAKFRVNGALANSPEFAKDFRCHLGSRMNPVKKCSIW